MKNNRYTGRPSLKWLFEQADAEADKNAAAPDSVSAEKIAALWKLPYAQFVEQLKVVAKDPKLRAFLAAGKKDGAPGDEGVKVSATTIAGKALSPTQSEIDLGGSVGWSFKNPGGIAAFYSGGAWQGGDDPIITAGGKWVIDGHHRWSQAMVFNPDVTLACININIADPEMALKMTQAAIAVTKGDVPTQGVKQGMNVYGMGFNDIIAKFAGGGSTLLTLDVVKQLQGKLVVSATPDEIEAANALPNKPTGPAAASQKIAQASASGVAPASAYGEMSQALKEQINMKGFEGLANVGNEANTGTVVPSGDPGAQWGTCAASLAHNCKTLPAAGKFPRPKMPQTGTGDGGPGSEGLSTALQSGDINFKPGYDIQKESVRFDLDRWKLLAGINKRG